ncbi:MAG: hypothetical protein ACR2RL_21010 [Gammaproteobacteria bacterium]
MAGDSERNDAGRTYTSAFDELLERNRQQFDALYRKSGAAPIERLLEERPQSITAPAPSRSPASVRDVGTPVRESATARSLRARYGDDWTFDVTERQRDGDQIIVLGKLTLKGKGPGKNIVKAQFGHATMNGFGASTATEERAYEEASEAALARCAALL